MSKIKKGALILFLVANLYAILCGGLYFFQENLLFHPTQLTQDYTYDFKGDFEEVTIETDDGAKLNGLHFKNETPKATIVYYHGNAGNLSRWGEIVQYFVKQQIDVIVMDYRGYGKSTGIRTEPALYEDSMLWYAYAKTKADTSNTPLLVYGRSLGTTFATYAASLNSPKQLILETPFYSIENEAKSRFPILPVGKLLKFKFPTADFINAVQAPITILHGTDDSVVDYKHGKALFNTIQQSNKSLVTIPDGGHNNLVTFSVFREAISRILP